MQTGPADIIDKEELSNTCSHLFGLVLTRGIPHKSQNVTNYYFQNDLFGTNQIYVRKEVDQCRLTIVDKHLSLNYAKNAGNTSGSLHAEIFIDHEGSISVLEKEGPWQDHLKEIHSKIKQLVQNLPSYILTIENPNDAKFARARELYNV